MDTGRLVINPSHVCWNMPEYRRNENLLYILRQSKCILKIPAAFCVHSTYSGIFLCLAGMFCSCAKLSGCIGRRESMNGVGSVF